MRIFIILILTTSLLISCGKEETESNSRDCLELEYDKEIQIQLSNKVCFPNGNSLVFTNIEHKFCPCGVFCGWSGALYITLTTSYDDITIDKKFYIGEDYWKTDIFDNYEISSLVYSYGAEDEEVPECAEDFIPEKITISLSIT